MKVLERDSVLTYDGFPGMSPTLEPAVETSPEPDVLRREVQSQNLRLGRVVVQRVDELVRGVGEVTPQGERLLVQLQLSSLFLTIACNEENICG